MNQALSQAQGAESNLWLEAAAFGVVICDAAMTVVKANGRGGELLGRVAEDLCGRPLLDLLELDEQQQRQIAQAFAQQLDWQGVARSAGRALKVDIRGAGAGAVVSLIDYSADLDHLRQVSEARAVAEKANEARTQFLSQMSHELRTPLNAIIGFTQLLKVSSRLDAVERDNVSEIESASAALLTLINEILDLSRIETGKLKLSEAHIDLAALVDECSALIAPLAQPRGIQIETRIARDTLLVADHLRLKQILLNLLSNAVKYNHDGGQVIVCSSTIRPETLRLEIRDSGTGIAPDLLSTIFSPFDRLGSIEGSGIGLMITRRLVALMEGNIGVCSLPERGSVFWVELPRKRLSVLESIFQQSGSANAGTAKGPLFWIGERTSLFTALESLRELRPALVLRRYASLSTLEALATETPALVLLTASAAQALGQSGALHKTLKRARLLVVMDSRDCHVPLDGENAMPALPLYANCKLTTLLDLLDTMGGTE